jgi:hypothetical protein
MVTAKQISSWQTSTSECLYPKLQLFAMESSNHLMLHIDLHGTLTHFCCTELFLHTNSFTSHTCTSNWEYQYNISMQNLYTHLYTHPLQWEHVQVHNICFQTHILHFSCCHMCGQILVAITEGVTHVFSTATHHTHKFMEITINIRVKIIPLHHNGLIRNNGMTPKKQDFHRIYQSNKSRYVVLRKDNCLVYREWKESEHIMHFQTVMNTTAQLLVLTL